MNKLSSSLATALALSAVSGASAANINMSADNAGGSSGFNAGTGWVGGAAPTSGNNYFTNDFLLRTPAVANTNFTFAGDSLTVNAIGNTLSPTTATGTDLNDALIYKGTGTAIITINNLTFDGGILRNGSGDGDTMRLAGNSLTVTSAGMGVHVQGPLFVDAPVHGSSFIAIYDNGSTSAARNLHFTSSANTFDGDIFLATANRSRFTLADTGVFNFSVSGTSTSNTISGAGVATIDGTIKIDTTAADLTLNNTWNLISASSKSFGLTFAVDGYSDLGGGIWSNGMFEFSTATGDLVLAAIPEPSTYAMLAGGLMLGVVALKRRRRAV